MLTGKQRRHLRGLGHELKPIVLVGKNGIDDSLIAALDQALADHELVKLRIGEGADVDRHEAATQLADKTRSEVAQVLGNTVLLYRPDPEDPKIELPRAPKGAAQNDNEPETDDAASDDADGDDDDD
jgi:RNA-binding protein